MKHLLTAFGILIAATSVISALPSASLSLEHTGDLTSLRGSQRSGSCRINTCF